MYEALLSASDVVGVANDRSEQEHRSGGKGDVGSQQDRHAQSVAPKVFIVHGHDLLAREQAARLLSELGMTPIVLAEGSFAGRTVIEAIEDNRDAVFSLVLLTPDDVGASAANPSAQRPRARQNVLLEFGYFCASLGRQRICVLMKGEIEMPSDFAGVMWKPMDPGGAWRVWVAADLEAAGLSPHLRGLLHKPA
jgi:predicted nucleotide-binding protein